MSDLSYDDRLKFEKLFFSSGYVMDFSNQTFREFVQSAIKIDIYNGKYESFGTSKANHLRAFWQVESNYNVAVLNMALLEHWSSLDDLHIDSPYFKNQYNERNYILLNQCKEICSRLKDNTVNSNLNSISFDTEDTSLAILYQLISDSLIKNSPETALDRLHTFTLKYIKNKAKKYQIDFVNESLNGIFRDYLKKLDENNAFESEMSKKILTYSISILHCFNEVRNSKTFAHDNDLLKSEEGYLIFNNIINLLKFIDIIDPDINNDNIYSDNMDCDLPF